MSYAQTAETTGEFYRQPAAAEAATAAPQQTVPAQGTTTAVQGEAPAQGETPAQDPGAIAVEKSRKLSRTFAAVPGKSYALETRYGRVQINTWSRKEIRTDVEVITRASTDEKAQQLQDMIQVQLQANDPATGGVSARSRFGLMPKECWSKRRIYEVNYTIWLPKNTPLKLQNTFGEISINGDLTGSTDLAVHYGQLRAGRLDGAQNAVRVSNGQATVAYARAATIDACYSRLRLNAGKTIELRNNYSDIDMGTVQDLTVHSKYGDVVLGTVHSLSGSSGFSKFSIDKLDNKLDMKVQYCPAFEVRNTGKNFRQINLDGGYSTFLLNFAADAGFNFDVNTDHGKLLVDKEMVKVASEESNEASSDTQGSFGAVQARNASNVNIKVRYGNVSFNR
ncbi:hypothetical protein [Hymenobacter defluvii]|uniref:Adhesin domain-containing protein n=1 Tax=Hymenobacter defluvii TaxID=2054411 RepID=A0ABS3TGY3_9BACT|nr:hypothetical protein [Hymenobacter defluvii]MBO3272920.1 hypothetical protein [Hymenobacter defluvii]